MEDSSKAKASIAALNDFNLKGNRIRVEVRVVVFLSLSLSRKIHLIENWLAFNNTSSKFWSIIVRRFIVFSFRIFSL